MFFDLRPVTHTLVSHTQPQKHHSKRHAVIYNVLDLYLFTNHTYITFRLH